MAVYFDPVMNVNFRLVALVTPIKGRLVSALSSKVASYDTLSEQLHFQLGDALVLEQHHRLFVV